MVLQEKGVGNDLFGFGIRYQAWVARRDARYVAQNLKARSNLENLHGFTSSVYLTEYKRFLLIFGLEDIYKVSSLVEWQRLKGFVGWS